MENIKTYYKKTNFRSVRYVPDTAEPPEGYTLAEPLSDTAYQKFDEKTGSWMHDEETELRIQMTAERDIILDEIAKRDYRAWKAVKLGKPIDELYPGESDWYKAKIQRFTELEAILSGED
jgi:hypothetical protein